MFVVYIIGNALTNKRELISCQSLSKELIKMNKLLLKAVVTYELMKNACVWNKKLLGKYTENHTIDRHAFGFLNV